MVTINGKAEIRIKKVHSKSIEWNIKRSTIAKIVIRYTLAIIDIISPSSSHTWSTIVVITTSKSTNIVEARKTCATLHSVTGSTDRAMAQKMETYRQIETHSNHPCINVATHKLNNPQEVGIQVTNMYIGIPCRAQYETLGKYWIESSLNFLKCGPTKVLP